MTRSTRRRFLLQAAGLVATATARGAAPLRAQRAPVIDCHVHVGIGETLLSPSTSIADSDEILRNMAKAGIDRSVIFPIRNADYLKPNRAIAEYCRLHPAKYIGFARHDGKEEKGRIMPMARSEILDLGLRGFKLKENVTPEIMDAAAELGVPVLYHPPTVPMFIDFARKYPGVDMILAHLGGVTYSRRPESHVEAIEAAKAFSNVYLDTSTVLETRYLERAVSELPAEKLIFGSDAPDCDSRLEIFKIRMLRLAPSNEALVLGGNLQRLLDKVRPRKG